MLQIHLLQQLSAGLARGLDAECGSMGSATQGVLGWSGPLSLGPWVPGVLAADPSSKEMFGAVAGNVRDATLKPVAVLLPTGLNTSKEYTFFCAFLNISLQGEKGSEMVVQVERSTTETAGAAPFHLQGGDAVPLCCTDVAGAHCLLEPPHVLQLGGVSRDPAPHPTGRGLPGAFNTGH